MFMVMLVLDDPQQLDAVLEAWAERGVTGATIVESTGLHRRRKHIPMRYAYAESLVETGNVTLFVAVQDEDMVKSCLAAVEDIVGDLSGPNTGVMMAWPIPFSKGIQSGEGEHGMD